MLITIISVLIIIILFAYTLWGLRKNAKGIIDDTSLLIKLFKDVDKKSIFQKHFEISDAIISMLPEKDLCNLWLEFEESLVFTENSVENTIDSQHFFNQNSIAYNVFDNNRLKWFPNLLIGVGVLFTFLGLVHGLSGIDISSDDIDALKLGIGGVINGAYLAFISSIFGILFSLIYSFFYYKRKDNIHNNIINLQKTLDYVYPRATPEKSLFEIKNYSKATEEHLGALGETLGESLHEAVRTIGQDVQIGIQEAFRENVQPFMSNLTEQTLNSSESALNTIMETFLERITAAGEEQSRLIQEVNKEIQDSLVSFRKDFVGQVEGLKETIEKLNTSYHFIEEVLIKNLESIINSLRDGIQQQAEAQERFSQQTQRDREAQQQFLEQNRILVEKYESIQGELGEMLRSFNQQNSRLNESFSLVLDNMDTAVQANSKSSEMLSEAADQIKVPFENLRSEYELMRQEVKNNMEEMADRMNKVLNTYFTSVQDQTNKRMQEWNTNTLQFSKSMYQVTTEMNSLVERLHKNTDKL